MTHTHIYCVNFLFPSLGSLAVKESRYAVRGEDSVVSSQRVSRAFKEMDETTVRVFLLSAWERVR